MKRKIIEHGTSNAVTLPKKWFDKYGLKHGEELNVEENGPKLIISAEQIKAKRETIKIEQELFIPYVHKVIGKICIAGYDHIAIIISDQKDMDKVEAEALKNVLGLEMIKKTDKEITFDIVISDTQEQYEKYERKTFQTAIEYAKFILELIEKKEYAKLDNRSLEMLNNKFSVFCERYLNKTLSKDCIFKYIIIWNLEKITDEYKLLTRFVKEHNVQISKETKEYFKKAIKYLEDFQDLYYSFAPSKYSKMNQDKIKLINKEGNALRLKKTVPETIVISKLMNTIVTVFNCLGNVLAMHVSEFSIPTVKI